MRCRRAFLGSALGSVDEVAFVTSSFVCSPARTSPSFFSSSSSSSQSLASSCSFSALLLSFLFKFFFWAADNEGNCPLLVKSGAAGVEAKKEEDDCDVEPGTNDLSRADWAEDWLRYRALSSSGVKPGRTFSSLRMLRGRLESEDV